MSKFIKIKDKPVIEDDFTFCMAVSKFPFGEISLSSIKHFYPKAKIIIEFGKKDQFSELRKKFFLCRNVEIIEPCFEHDLFGAEAHGYHIDRIIKRVKTKYFIVLDDDTLMHQTGLLENLKSVFKSFDVYAHISDKIYDHPSIVPYCFSMKKDIYLKYNMTFKPFFTQGFKIDTGNFIFIDCLKYNLKIKKLPVSDKYVYHLCNSSHKFWYKNKYLTYSKIKRNIMNHCDGVTIPLLERDFFEKPELTFDKKYYEASLIGKDIIEGNTPDFSFFCKPKDEDKKRNNSIQQNTLINHPYNNKNIPPLWIFSIPRSGSTYLCRSLDETFLLETNDYFNFQEHYNLWEISHSYYSRQIFNAVYQKLWIPNNLCHKYNPDFSQEFANKLRDKVEENHGLYDLCKREIISKKLFPKYNKVFPFHFAEWTKEDFKSLNNYYPNLKCLYLIRKNFYEQVISFYFALSTKYWNFLSNDDRIKKYLSFKMRFDEKEILKLYRYKLQEREKCLEYLNKIDSSVHIVYYEDLCDSLNEEIYKICKYMNVDDKDIIDIKNNNYKSGDVIKVVHPQKKEFVNRLKEIVLKQY